MPLIIRVKNAGARKAIACVGNHHNCHKISLTGLHIGGAIMTGSSFVSIDGKSVARVGDKAHCHPAKDTIKHGIDNFRINGVPVAVSGSHCKHGGVVTEGSPYVFIEEFIESPESAETTHDVALSSAQAESVGKHWIQAQLIDPPPGTTWHICHTDGTNQHGVVDHEGKTEKVTALKPGTSTVVFGDKEKLEQDLVNYRKQFKNHLDNILQTTRALADKEQKQYHPDDDVMSGYLYNAAVAASFVEGAVEGAWNATKSGAKHIAHLFEHMAEDQAMLDQARYASLHGDTKELAEIQQHFIDEGNSLVKPIEQAKLLLESLYRDKQSREILEDFVSDYIHSATPMMLSKETGELVGGLAPAIAIAVVTKEVTLVPSEALMTSSSEIIAAGETAEKIVKTLDKSEDVATLETEALDQNHVIIKRPKGLDVGAAHESQVNKLPGYEAEDDLTHFSGEDYYLPIQEAENFYSRPTPKKLVPGTKLYRIVDDTKNTDINGRYWLYDLPQNKTGWRRNYAVKSNWNKNGYYVEYMVPEEGLSAWEGEASSQEMDDEGFSGWVLEGGAKQVFVPMSHSEIPESLIVKKTQWK